MIRIDFGEYSFDTTHTLSADFAAGLVKISRTAPASTGDFLRPQRNPCPCRYKFRFKNYAQIR
ncbi:MAG TPA: hypothetical protein DDX91_09255 [Ruminococcaceae bacterium]|nr:hypothetical protein [Oscillospiraceae bacterium]